MAVLQEVVGHVREDRVGPQQILSADHQTVPEAGVPRKNAVKRVGQIAIQITVIPNSDAVILHAPAVHVVAVIDEDLVVAGIGCFQLNPVRQLTLEADGILVSPRDLEAWIVEADAVSDAGSKAQARAGWSYKPIR